MTMKYPMIHTYLQGVVCADHDGAPEEFNDDLDNWVFPGDIPDGLEWLEQELSEKFGGSRTEAFAFGNSDYNLISDHLAEGLYNWAIAELKKNYTEKGANELFALINI
jgi:hypothetical protein